MKLGLETPGSHEKHTIYIFYIIIEQKPPLFFSIQYCKRGYETDVGMSYMNRNTRKTDEFYIEPFVAAFVP
jgi:hypothetical protein